MIAVLGSPAQETGLKDHLPQLKVKVCQCVGGTLDTIAGKVKRAQYCNDRRRQTADRRKI